MRLTYLVALTALLAPLGSTALAADPASSKPKATTKAAVAGYSVASVVATSSAPAVEAANQRCLESVVAQQLAQAESLCVQAVGEAEKSAPNTKHHATAISNLASLLALQGKLIEAETDFKRALAMYESAMGPNHLSVATSLSQLAGFYYQHDRYAEAEPLYRRALNLDERALGADHPEVAKDLYNLGIVLALQGKHKEADAAHQRCLVVREKVLGTNDPAVARSLAGIGTNFAMEGRLSEAEKAFERATQISEAALGADHPETRYCRGWLDKVRTKRLARFGE